MQRGSGFVDVVQRFLWILVPILIGGITNMFADSRKDVQAIVWLVVLTIIVIGVWFTATRRRAEIRDAEREEREEQRFGELDSKLNDIDSRIDVMSERFDRIDKSDRALMRNELVRAHREWVEEKGWITLEALEFIDETYDEYHSRGGNGSGTRLWEDIHRLPIMEHRSE